MGTPLKSALLKPGVVSSPFVGEQNAPGTAFSKSSRDEAPYPVGPWNSFIHCRLYEADIISASSAPM
ncbi:uncharacterized protein LOC142804028 isoform X2 [Rhipicephalus microplus]|uniref:uncharacterized protein LOC142804028 isoform X2 n=1 Tax=Rhipicephalus microplus TaxID=6941 RepID=UPI003F6C6815